MSEFLNTVGLFKSWNVLYYQADIDKKVKI